MHNLLRHIILIFIFQTLLITITFSQQISSEQIKERLKKATITIRRDYGTKKTVCGFFIADQILLTSVNALQGFDPVKLLLEKDIYSHFANYTDITPTELKSKWTLIRLDQMEPGISYEVLKFADQLPAYPSPIYSYNRFSDVLNISNIEQAAAGAIGSDAQFCTPDRAGVPVVNSLGHVIGIYKDNTSMVGVTSCFIHNLIPFMTIFSGLGAITVATPAAHSNSAIIPPSIPVNILSSPVLCKIFANNLIYVVIFIDPKHFILPKSAFVADGINIGTAYPNNVATSVKFKKVFDDPLSNVIVMKVSFPNDISFPFSPISGTNSIAAAKVFGKSKFNYSEEDFVREVDTDQNGVGVFSIGGYHPLNSHVFDRQGSLIGLVKGAKNGRAIVIDLATRRQAILQTLTN